MKKVMLGLVVSLVFQVCTSELNEIDGVIGGHVDAINTGGGSISTIPSDSFLGQYFSKSNGGDPISSRIENRIRHDFNSPVKKDVNVNELSAKWTGDFYFESGEYNFAIKSDKGIKVMIGNEVILNDPENSENTTYSINQQLDGVERVIVEYNVGNEVVVDPNPVDPVVVDPAPVDPVVVDPAPVDPVVVDPAPVDPVVVDPAPVDPAPVDPVPADPVVEVDNTTPTVEVDWTESDGISEIGDPEIADYYLSPSGSDNNPGTKDKPFFSLNKAWSVVQAGDLVYLRGGTYEFTKRQTLANKSGTTSDLIQIFAYPGETPVIQPASGYTDWQFIVINNVDYLHMKGIEFANFDQPSSKYYEFVGVNACENSTFERVDVHDAVGGMILKASRDCLVLNCDFYRNRDPLGSNGTNLYGNADGLAVSYTPLGATNTVRGCRMWWNSDDGIDMWASEGKVIVEDTWAFWNGFVPGGFNNGGDGNGFKLGQSSNNAGLNNRLIRNCLLFQNSMWGVNTNNYVGDVELSNNTIYQNAYQGYISWSGGITLYNGGVYNVKNNISYKNIRSSGEVKNYSFTGTDNSSNNSWDGSVNISDSDFVSIDTEGVTAARKEDGSLPDIDFLRLVSDSDLIDNGKDVGLPYNGSAPDLGAYESE